MACGSGGGAAIPAEAGVAIDIVPSLVMFDGVASAAMVDMSTILSIDTSATTGRSGGSVCLLST
jgi:hypothetical protein